MSRPLVATTPMADSDAGGKQQAAEQEIQQEMAGSSNREPPATLRCRMKQLMNHRRRNTCAVICVTIVTATV